MVSYLFFKFNYSGILIIVNYFGFVYPEGKEIGAKVK